MKYSYTKIPPNNPQEKWSARPLLNICIVGPKDKVNVTALIDSGADCSLFNEELALEIGLKLQGTRKKFFGIGNQGLDATMTKVKIKPDGFNEIEIEAGFVEKGAPFAAILGQKDFFDNFRIKFMKDVDTIEITTVA